jgi:hypothetical protein
MRSIVTRSILWTPKQHLNRISEDRPQRAIRHIGLFKGERQLPGKSLRHGSGNRQSRIRQERFRPLRPITFN